MQVVDLRLDVDVQARLRDRRITLDVDDKARKWLAKQGYDERYGAREVGRVVRTEVVQPIARALLKGTIRDGDKVVVRVDEEEDLLVVKENHEPDDLVGSRKAGGGLRELEVLGEDAEDDVNERR